MVIFRAVEDHDRSFKRLGIVRIRQVTRAKLGSDHAGLHDRRIEQIAAQHDETGIRRQRVANGRMTRSSSMRGIAAVVADSLAIDGRGILG